MQFRKTLSSDSENIVEFYQNVCAAMQGSKRNAQWEYGVYPTREDLMTYLKDSRFLILEDKGKIAACLAYSLKPQQGYEAVDWLKKEGRIIYLHLVAVDPGRSGKGLGRRLLKNAVEYLKPDAVHLDCIKENDAGISFYKKYGFHDHGLHPIWYPDTGWIDYRIFEYPPR